MSYIKSLFLKKLQLTLNSSSLGNISLKNISAHTYLPVCLKNCSSNSLKAFRSLFLSALVSRRWSRSTGLYQVKDICSGITESSSWAVTDLAKAYYDTEVFCLKVCLLNKYDTCRAWPQGSTSLRTLLDENNVLGKWKGQTGGKQTESIIISGEGKGHMNTWGRDRHFGGILISIWWQTKHKRHKRERFERKFYP